MDQEEYRQPMAFVKEVPDPRQARGTRHNWEVILAVIYMARAHGQKNAWAIGCWAKHRTAMLCDRLNTQLWPTLRRLESPRLFFTPIGASGRAVL